MKHTTPKLFPSYKNILLFLALCGTFATGLFGQTRPDALKMYKNRQYDDAIAVCLGELDVNAHNINSYIVLVWSLIAKGQYADAYSWCQKAKAVSEYDPSILFSMGEAGYALGKNADAIENFEKYIVYAPNGGKIAYVYYYLGEIYVRLKKFAHADIAFSTAVTLNSKMASWWERLGYAREQFSDYTSALEAYEAALRLDKNLRDAQNGKARMINRLQR